jgi:hypothetical protein
MKAKIKNTKMTTFCCHLLCLRGARTRGGKDNNDHKLLLYFVFHKNDEGQKEKKYKDDDFVLLSLCLKGVRIGGGKDDDYLKSSSSFVFHKNDEGQKKHTKMTT